MRLGVSTSGRSRNVLQAVRVERSTGMNTIALVGTGGASILEDADICIRVPTANAQRIQELHTEVLHVICEVVERVMFPHMRRIFDLLFLGVFS